MLFNINDADAGDNPHIKVIIYEEKEKCGKEHHAVYGKGEYDERGCGGYINGNIVGKEWKSTCDEKGDKRKKCNQKQPFKHQEPVFASDKDNGFGGMEGKHKK